jgi:adenylosuccinate synthase
MEWRQVFDELMEHAKRLRPLVCDVSLLLNEVMRSGKSVLFEGAQGTLLDIDHGTYPYVTSSNASVGGVCTGLGIGPRSIGGVLGVVKATTRAGRTAADRVEREMGQILVPTAATNGAVTGRPRRCGWVRRGCGRYGVRINGLDALALTVVCSTVSSASISAAAAARARDGFPRHRSAGHLQPVYESMPGWSTPTKAIRRFGDLPDAARRYIARLEEVTGVPAAVISTGSERDDTILREDVLAARLPRFQDLVER